MTNKDYSTDRQRTKIMATVESVGLSDLDNSSVYPGLKIAGPAGITGIMVARKVSRKKKDIVVNRRVYVSQFSIRHILL